MVRVPVVLLSHMGIGTAEPGQVYSRVLLSDRITSKLLATFGLELCLKVRAADLTTDVVIKTEKKVTCHPSPAEMLQAAC